MRAAKAPWHLASAEEFAARAPLTFTIPDREERESLLPGQVVKLMFQTGEARERMWVKVTDLLPLVPRMYLGTLDSTPMMTSDLAEGDVIAFGPEHIIQIDQG